MVYSLTTLPVSAFENRQKILQFAKVYETGAESHFFGFLLKKCSFLSNERLRLPASQRHRTGPAIAKTLRIPSDYNEYLL